MSLPWATGQVPVHFAQKPTGRPRIPPLGIWGTRYLDIPNGPLFPFGHGLTYTTFAYGDLRLSAATISADAPLRAGILLTNSGNRAGTEVVQLYVHDEVASIAPPARLLRGIQPVALAPGESRRVEFTLTLDDLRFWNAELRFVVEPGTFRLWIGPDAKGGLEGTFSVAG